MLSAAIFWIIFPASFIEPKVSKYLPQWDYRPGQIMTLQIDLIYKPSSKLQEATVAIHFSFRSTIANSMLAMIDLGVARA